LNELGKQSAKPLALVYIGSVSLGHAKPRMGSIDGKGPVLVDPQGHSITDEGFGDHEAGDNH
jgi:hypothetical protein